MALHFLRLIFTIVIMAVTAHAAVAKPTILFLPLNTRYDATPEIAAQVTKMVLESFSKLDVAKITLAPDLLGEIGVDTYTHNNQKIRARISEIAKPDYILFGHVQIDKIDGYSLHLHLASFTTGAYAYARGYLGNKDKDWDSLVNSHLQAMPRVKIFIKDPEAKRAATLAILTRYCPDGAALIGEVLKKSDFDILTYSLGDHPVAVELNSVVHEGCHDYTISPGFLSFFIDRKETIKFAVSVKDTFPSKELAEVIPMNLRDMCYNQYILNFQSTQVIGIYGLLNELNAYYHGTLASCDLFEYYRKEVFKKEPRVFFDYLYGVESTAVGYYQFKYFIFEYLLYAQAKHPEMYRKIIANKEFIDVVRKIDALFRNLIVRMANNEKELSSLLAARGCSLFKKDGYTYIGETGYEGNRSNSDKSFMLFRDELKNPRFAAVEAIFK